jgi:hypothetical protein
MDQEILMARNKHRQNYAAQARVISDPTAGQIVTPPPSVLGGQELITNQGLPPNLEVGTTGLAQFTGLIFQEPLVELRGKEAFKRFNEMRLNSPIIGALLLSIENPLRSTSWTFTSDDRDDPRLELLEDARRNLEHSWNDHISEALTMLPFGFSIFEMVYELVDGKMLWRSFSPRGQDTVYRWLYEEVQNSINDQSPKQRLKGFVQLAPPKYHPTSIPIERLMIYRLHTERDNPEGRSILRTAWVPYYYIKHIQQIEAIGIERDLAGLPVISLPMGATTGGADTDDKKAAKIVRNIRNDEQSGIVLPQGWSLSLLSTGGSKQIDTDKTINRYEKRILTSALAQFLMLGQDGVGALALSKDQTDFFTMSVNAVGDIIAETFTKTAIKQLMDLNGYDAKGLRLEHTPAQGNIGITAVADFLQKVGSFITWTPEDEVWLRNVVNLPEKDVDSLAGEMQLRQVAKDAASAEAMARLKQMPAQKPTPPESDQEEPIDKGPDAYSAAIDAKKREKREREFTRAMNDFFGAQKKRILKAAKDLK